MTQLNEQVTKFLDQLQHPFRKEIELLRHIILDSNDALKENIKWNGPNYCLNNEDHITMKIQPPKQIQIIFHRGAKVRAQPQNNLIIDDSGLLIWKANDRAVATFKSTTEINLHQTTLSKIVRDWLEVSI